MPAGQIDAALLEQIKERTPLAPLISRNVHLKRSGGTHVGCCPFHGEKTPSFHVYHDHFKCFGCGEHGDAISFVQKINRSSFTEAVRDLAQQAGLEIPGAAKALTSAERERREQESAAAREREAERLRRQEAERQADHEAIRRVAKKVWDRAEPADPDHPYLVRKGLAGDVEGLRQDKRGNLLVPRRDANGELWNIERILPEKTESGKDKFTLSRSVDGERKGGRVEALYTVFGDLDAAGPLAISTGIATAKSVRRATGWTTVGVGSDSNLLVVAQAMRQRFPERELIIAGDNDIRLESRLSAQGVPMENQGRTKAEAAAEAVRGTAAIPPFPGNASDSDWNDYERLHGAAAAGGLLAAARQSLNPGIEEDPMPDASGSAETNTPRRRRQATDLGPELDLNPPLAPTGQPAQQQPSRQVDWTTVVEKLRAAHDNTDFQQAEPRLTKRAANLLADIGEGADLQDQRIRTRIAYLVSDIDRATGASLVLPPELRSEVDRLAVSYPGLDHPDIQEMLRQTASMEAKDYQTIEDVRMLARDYVNHDPANQPDGAEQVIAERIKVMEARVRDTLAGPEAPPHAQIPEHNAVPTTSTAPQIDGQDPQPAAATPVAQPQPAEARADQPQAQARQQANQAQQQQTVQAQASRQAQAQQPQPAGTITIPMSAASRMLNRLMDGQTNGPPPWRGLASALSDRLAPYQQAQADRYHRDLERSVEVSGKAAVKALTALVTGPAADVMRKIGQEAARDPNGATGVIEQMRPGGKHEALRNEYNAVFARDNSFGADFDRSKVALTNYLDGRNALEENYHRRGWPAGDLDEKLKDIDRAIAGVAERVPGRESGKSLSEELAKKAMELAEALYQKIRRAFGKIQSTVSPEATAAASSSPSMSPAP